MSDFKEPWEVGEEHESMACVWAGGKTIFRVERGAILNVSPPYPGEFAERIVACVNFCRDLPTEELMLYSEPSEHHSPWERFLMMAVQNIAAANTVEAASKYIERLKR